MSQTESDLTSLAERIRRNPQLAQEMDVSALAARVAARWRERSDMMAASEEVPVAAWIVRRKVEGLVRPEVEETEPEPFDPNKRPDWLTEGVEGLKKKALHGQRYWPHEGTLELRRLPAPVRDASPWTLAWSYPRLRPKKARPVATVAYQALPLRDHIEAWLDRLSGGEPVSFHEAMTGEPRREWAVAFLAAVHLWHERLIDARQSEAFAPLILQRRATSEVEP